MKRLELEHCSAELRRLCEAAQLEHVLLTHDGKPVAMIVGRMHKDDEDIQLEASPAFWRMIQDRRTNDKTIPLADLEKEFAAKEKRVKKRKAPIRPAKRPSAVR
jgi:hypothetical protein